MILPVVDGSVNPLNAVADYAVVNVVVVIVVSINCGVLLIRCALLLLELLLSLLLVLL